MASGKRQWGACTGQQASLPVKSPAENPNLQNDNVITIAAVKSTATVIKGTFGGVVVEVMLDSGSSVSLVQLDVLQGACNVIQVTTARSVQLVTASGDKLPILQHVKASIQLGKLNVIHKFVVVKPLWPLSFWELTFYKAMG